jgi:hypothetical protein
MTTFNDLLAQNIGLAFARQLAFADYLGERNWSVDIQQGTCGFGDDLSFPLQLLGTEAEDSDTWLWAWANEASNLPTALLQSCNALKELGVKLGIRELTERSFPLDVASGHTLASIASGMDGQCCYYRGPYPGGALFFLVKDVPAELLRPVPAERAISVMGEVISQFEVNHRTMVESFLKSQGFALAGGSGQLSATRDADNIVLSFDNLQRLTGIEGKLQPRSKPKPWWKFW